MRYSFPLLAVFAASIGLASPCKADFRTYVSGVGSDANNCYRTAPCQSFSAAFGHTSDGGEIDCLDGGDKGPVTITRSVSIICDAANGTAQQTYLAQNAQITVSLSDVTQKVVLSGLILDGFKLAASGPTKNGVLIQGLGTVTIRNSVIKNFETAGINLQGSAGMPATRVVIQNSYITNSGIGVTVAGAGGATNNAEVVGTLIDSNTTGISVTGPGALILSASTLTGQPTAISTSNGGQVISYGNNVIRNAGTPTQTLPLQ